jgi:hypothetical protein
MKPSCSGSFNFFDAAPTVCIPLWEIGPKSTDAATADGAVAASTVAPRIRLRIMACRG